MFTTVVSANCNDMFILSTQNFKTQRNFYLVYNHNLVHRRRTNTGQWILDTGRTLDTSTWFYILSNSMHCIALDRQKRNHVLRQDCLQFASLGLHQIVHRHLTSTYPQDLQWCAAKQISPHDTVWVYSFTQTHVANLSEVFVNSRVVTDFTLDSCTVPWRISVLWHYGPWSIHLQNINDKMWPLAILSFTLTLLSTISDFVSFIKSKPYTSRALITS